MEKKKSFFERRPYVCYALYAGLLFAFNLFLRWWSGELDADEYLMSAINTLILTAGFVWGDRYRRKNLANKKKIDELLNNKENNGFKIAVLAGDGIGPEISTVGVDVMTAVCEKFGHKVNYEYAICGADAIDKVGDPFPEANL